MTPEEYKALIAKGNGKAKKRASSLKHSLRIGKVTIKLTDEGLEQYKVAEWLRLHKIFFIHPANEAKRNMLEGVALKALGLEPGTSDLIIFDPPRLFPGCPGAAIEMKTSTGKANDNQKAFLSAMEVRGWKVGIAYGSAHAIELLKLWGYGR